VYVAGIKYWQSPEKKENDRADYLDMKVRLPYALSIVEVLSYKFKKEDSFTLHELGCGWGTNLGVIHEYLPNSILTGNDVWKDALTYVKQNREYIDVVEKDSAEFIENYCEQNKKLDVIITNAHLIHLEDNQLPVLNKLHAICRIAILQENISNIEEAMKMKLVEKKTMKLPDCDYRYFFEV
jgi:trans-aconitate methyltransferase